MSDGPPHPPHRHLTPETVRFCPLCGSGLERRPVGPDRRSEMVCPACEFVYYIDQKVVAGTLPIQDGRILLTRRAIHPAYGKWTFPGGYVDWGESVDAAALRETWEETGLTVELRGLVGVYSYEKSPVVIVVYEARVLPRVGHARGDPVEGAGVPLHGGGAARFSRAAWRRGSRAGQRATHVTALSRSPVR
jgi:ADP-ribose pyrophosphatase YjhB (NUDIX family)